MAVQFRPLTAPTDEELAYLNAQNPDLRFERTLSGEISLSPPTGLSTGSQNSELTAQIVIWNRTHGHGKVLDSSTGISIGLNGAPDAGWISGARYDRIPKKQRTQFLKTPPELVFELRSPSDRMATLARRAAEWVQAGVTTAVVLNPRSRTATPYTATGPGKPAMKRLTIDKAVLPGATEDLIVDLDAVFDASL
jgi:Uma2 family endonuclease